MITVSKRTDSTIHTPTKTGSWIQMHLKGGAVLVSYMARYFIGRDVVHV